jgi:hypothetical protein
MDASDLKKLSRQLFKHYHAKLMAETTFMGTLDNSLFDSLEAQPNKVQTQFQKAAMSCAGVGARASEWIESQFDKFEEFTKFLGKRLVPQPGQIFGLTAQARYVQWKRDQADQDHRDKRSATHLVDPHKLEERNLKALMRSMRVPELDVLCEKPDEFSVEFLKSKGIYGVVKKKRRELRGGV